MRRCHLSSWAGASVGGLLALNLRTRLWPRRKQGCVFERETSAWALGGLGGAVSGFRVQQGPAGVLLVDQPSSWVTGAGITGAPAVVNTFMAALSFLPSSLCASRRSDSAWAASPRDAHAVESTRQSDKSGKQQSETGAGPSTDAHGPKNRIFYFVPDRIALIGRFC